MTNGQLRLRVRDDGKGIDPKLLSEDGRAGTRAARHAPNAAKVVVRQAGGVERARFWYGEVWSIPASHASETSALDAVPG